MIIKITLLIVSNLTFCLNDVETIDDIKAIIKSIPKTSAARLSFVSGGKVLDHDTSLADQNIREGSIIYVVEAGFQIFVRNLSGKTITIDNLHSYDTIGHVMNKIEKKDGVPCCHQLLVHAGKRLDDKETLDFYGIKKDSTLFMGSRLMSTYGHLEQMFHSIPEELTLAVKTSDTIDMVKKKIMNQFFSQNSTDRLLLAFNGKIINNNTSTLMVNNIQVGSIINIMLARPDWLPKRKRGWNEEDDEKAVCKKIRLACEIEERRQRLIDEEIRRERYRRLLKELQRSD